MPAPRPPLPDLPAVDRVVARIGVARQLAVIGRAEPARRLCGGLVVEHLAWIAEDPLLVRLLAECLLLLEMMAVLPRLVRAVFGVELRVAEVGEFGSRRWMLSFSHGITLLMPRADAALELGREERAVFWARRILATAAAGGVRSVAAGAGASDGFGIDAEDAGLAREEGELLERAP